MVKLPDGFVATRYAGYFWNIDKQELYSLKIDGVLKPLKRFKPSYWNHMTDGYQVSVNGRRRVMRIDSLMRLEYKDSTIPVIHERPNKKFVKRVYRNSFVLDR